MASKEFRVDARERLREEFKAWKANHPEVSKALEHSKRQFQTFFFGYTVASASDMISEKMGHSFYRCIPPAPYGDVQIPASHTIGICRFLFGTFRYLM